jgi:hypothetical protein
VSHWVNRLGLPPIAYKTWPTFPIQDQNSSIGEQHACSMNPPNIRIDRLPGVGLWVVQVSALTSYRGISST